MVRYLNQSGSKRPTKSKDSMPAIHVADLFFQEEITRAAGRSVANTWFMGNRCNAPHQRRSVEEYPRQCKVIAECQPCEPSDFDESGLAAELGENFGLMFTDAAHTVISKMKRSSSSR
jgi:hypothetical protein